MPWFHHEAPFISRPEVERFGEQPEVDALIRKYGYRPTKQILQLYKRNPDMQDIAHGAAHLVHGTSEGRFTIRYAPGKLTREEIEGVGYAYAKVDEALARCSPARMREGWNTMPDGERVFYISTPSAGPWSVLEDSSAAPCMRSMFEMQRMDQNQNL